MFASSVFRELIRHPRLWLEAARAYGAFTPRRWWRQPPFVPMPSKSYVRWRLQTAYGSPALPLRPADVIDYLEWRRSQR